MLRNYTSQRPCDAVAINPIGIYAGNAGWSSPVARQAHNLKAAGSNPAPATIFKAINNKALPSRRAICVFALRSPGSAQHFFEYCPLVEELCFLLARSKRQDRVRSPRSTITSSAPSGTRSMRFTSVRSSSAACALVSSLPSWS